MVDANGGFNLMAQFAGRKLLVQKTKTQGIAIMAIRNGFHFAAVWPDVEPLAAEHGLVAMAFLNSRAWVAHDPGGTKRLYGTNPMAFACPRGKGHPPFVFDQSTSAMARGEVQIAARDGKSLPPGKALDKEGRPTTDAVAATTGSLLPFGGHKGTNLAIMMELLAASFCQDQFGFQAMETDTSNDGGPTKLGMIVVCIDPNLGTGGRSPSTAFLTHLEALFERIVEDAPNGRLPSSRRFESRRITPQEGIEVPAALLEEEIRTLAGEAAPATPKSAL